VPTLEDGADSGSKSYQSAELTKRLWGWMGYLQWDWQVAFSEGQVVAVGAALPLQSSELAGVSGTSAACKNTCHGDYLCLFVFCLDTGPG